jgi:hypothetical protein
MKFARIGAALMAACVLGIAQTAHANTWVATCPGSGLTTLTLNPTTINPLSGGTSASFAADSAGGTNGGTTGSGTAAGAPDALGALLGTPNQGTEGAIATGFTGTTLESGDRVVINGMCVQDIELRTPGVTIEGFNANFAAGGVAPLAAPPDATTIGNNGVQGNFIVSGAQRITIDEVLLGSASGTITLNTNNSLDDIAVLFVTGASQLFMINSLIQGSPVRGVFVSSDSSATFESDTITENGIGQANQRVNMGLQANNASSVNLGEPNTGAFPVMVTDNAGDGVDATRASGISISGATITGNGQKQVFASGSSIRITGNNAATTTITAPAGDADPAVEAQGASSVLIEQGASIEGGTVAGSSAVALRGGSVALLQGSTIWSAGNTILATGASSVFLAGGNLICNGSVAAGTCTPAGGTAIDLEHVAALVGVEGVIGDANYPALGDTLFGGGAVVLQSSVDLGTGNQSAAASITWTTGAAGIVVAQNSSLRLEGGVQINGAITLTQGSNGFFNKTKGGVNNVTGGVACPFTLIPSSHVAGSTSVSATPPVVLSGSMTSTAPKQCLSF